MKQLVLFTLTFLVIASASAQKVSTKIVDNKGTIKWVLDSTTAVITKADSTVLYVTPTQLNDSLSGYLNDADNGLTVSGQKVQLGGALTQTTTITTTASEFLQITGLQQGSTTDSVVVIDPSSGQLKIVSTATLFNNLKAANGLTKSGDTVKLGGSLNQPTTITTSGSNTLSIQGLQSGSSSDSLVVMDGSTGQLKMRSQLDLLQSGNQNFTATANQSAYSVTNLPSAISKVWVYRNGVKLVATDDFTISGSNVNMTAPMTALIEAGDIIEVQWIK